MNEFYSFKNNFDYFETHFCKISKIWGKNLQIYAELCKFMQIFGEIIECIEFQIYFNYFIRIYVKLIHRIFMQMYGN